MKYFKVEEEYKAPDDEGGFYVYEKIGSWPFAYWKCIKAFLYNGNPTPLEFGREYNKRLALEYLDRCHKYSNNSFKKTIRTKPIKNKEAHD